MAFDKKEYNRQRQAERYEDYKQRRIKLVELLGGKCALCSADETELHLHHLHYDDEESNYPRHSKSMSVRWKRLIEAEKNPDRFALLCPQCHNAVEALKTLLDKGVTIESLVRYVSK